MVTKVGEEISGENGFHDYSVNLLVQHGRRQGYLTRKDIYDCIPDAEFDEELYEEILEALAEGGVEYLEEGPEEDAENGEPGEEDDSEEGQNPDEISRGNESEVDILEQIEAGDMVSLYIREAARVPLLKGEEEVELAQRIELCRLAQQELARGKVNRNRQKELRRLIQEGQQARERLIRANTRLVISVAKKYNNRGLPFLDLIQEGNIGLMRAVKNYDYRKGFKFSTYATWWIRQAISRALAEQSRTIRLPVHMSDQVNRMRRVQGQLQQDLGRAPSREELADALEVSTEKVDQLIGAGRQPVSLQTPVGEDEDEVLGDLIEDVGAPNPEESIAELMSNADLRERLEALPPRELQVLQLRYGLEGEEPLTLSEIGRRMGVTRERARQLEAQALKRLRDPDAADE
jgi:RNA polymerase primary sigma factor